MNKAFIIKMMKAKKMEYEAVKELMPDEIKGRWEEAEGKIKGKLKEIAAELIKEEMKAGKEEAGKDETAHRVKKVKVEF